MTNLSTYIRTMDPFFVGFDRLWDQLERNNSIYSTPANYPPYDIIRDGDKYTINLAVECIRENDDNVEIKDSSHTITVQSKSEHKTKKTSQESCAQ